MAKPKYSELEAKILNLFMKEKTFFWNETEYKIDHEKLGKPFPNRGESKTDVYILGTDSVGNEKELKISAKLPSFEFIENKITDIRAEQIFGENWKDLLSEEIKKVAKKFSNRALVTGSNRITLGWKLEIANESTRELQAVISPGKEAIEEIYAGKKLDKSKRNAKVNGLTIQNSGVANYLLVADENEINSVGQVLSRIEPISDMGIETITLIFTGYTGTPIFKETDSHTIPMDIELKTDGNRPLAIFIDWKYNSTTKELEPHINFEQPLIVKGNEVRSNLESAVEEALSDYTISKNKQK